MEVQRLTRYPMRGRAQVALPNKRVFSGHTLDISVGGVCILLDDQIPQGASYPIRFEITVNGKIDVITALAKAVYGVFASQGGFRVGFQFNEKDPQRTALIQRLAGKRPMVDQGRSDSAPVMEQQAPG